MHDERMSVVLLNLFLVAVLIVLTAFFVATEFAVIKLRPSRVDQMVMEGRKNAQAVRKVTNNLDGYLSACQLGITITALGLGWLGEPTVEQMLYPLFEQWGIGEKAGHVLSFGIAFVAITFLHVVLGELAPKTMAIRKAEAISVVTSPMIIMFHKVMYPFIWALNGSANAIVRAFGLKPASESEEAHSEEEIRIILSESYESGMINDTEYGYVNRIFHFDERMAKEIMVPRTDMVCLYEDMTLEELIAVVRKEQYTRFPIAKENKDNIIGFINTKQLFLKYDNDPAFDFRKHIHPALTVPEAIPVKSLLIRMQEEQMHLAILLDEYGGTSGLVTIEDILEEIVGEIRDEFDEDEKKPIETLGPGHYLVDGLTPIDEIIELLGESLDQDGIDTIGGWLYNKQSELAVGDPWVEGSVQFVIRERDKHRIRKLEIKKI